MRPWDDVYHEETRPSTKSTESPFYSYVFPRIVFGGAKQYLPQIIRKTGDWGAFKHVMPRGSFYPYSKNQLQVYGNLVIDFDWDQQEPDYWLMGFSDFRAGMLFFFPQYIGDPIVIRHIPSLDLNHGSIERKAKGPVRPVGKTPPPQAKDLKLFRELWESAEAKGIDVVAPRIYIWKDTIKTGPYRGNKEEGVSFVLKIPDPNFLAFRDIDRIIFKNSEEPPRKPLFRLYYDELGNLFYQRTIFG